MSLFILRSIIGAAVSRVRVATSQLAFLVACDLRDTKEYLLAAQELRLAEAQLDIAKAEYNSAFNAAHDATERWELSSLACEAGLSVA